MRCKLSECFEILCKGIYQLSRVVEVVVGAVVRSVRLFRKLYRESYCERLFISWNFGDTCEIVLVVSQDINCNEFIKFINDN